jgi:hypothetical protein
VRALLLVAAGILVLNVLYLAGVTVAEFRGHRRDRRQVVALERLVDPARHRRSGIAGRTLATAVAVTVLAGAAIVSPSTRDAVVSTVGGVVNGFQGGPEDEVAAGDDEDARFGSSATEGATSVPSVDEEHRSAGSAREAPEPEAPGADAPGSVARPSGETQPQAPQEASPAPSPDVDFQASARALTSSAIVVEWTAHPSATGFVVERSPDGATGWTEVARAVAGATSAPSEGLDPNVTYHFRVTALIDGGAAETAHTSATTEPAPATDATG